MKLNRFLLIIISLMIFISLGAVSASENLTFDEISADNEFGLQDVADYSIEDNLSLQMFDDLNVKDIEDGNASEDISNEEILSAGDVSPGYTLDIDLPKDGNAYVVQWGQPIDLTLNMPNATGFATITFADETFTGVFDNGILNYELTNYKKAANMQKLTIAYSGNDYCGPTTINENINVKLDDIIGYDAYFGQSAFVEVDLHGATGNVTFYHRPYTKIELVNGKVLYEFTDYPLGDIDIPLTYEGDENYNEFTKHVLINTFLSVDAPQVYIGQPAVITAHLFEATGKVRFISNDESYTVDIVNGVASCEFSNYHLGNNTVKIYYYGDENFRSFNVDKTFTVLDTENATILSLVYRNGDKNMVVVCIPQGTGTVNVTINGKKEILELVDGIARYDIDAGDVINEINVTYDGGSMLKPANATGFKELNNVVTSDNYMYYFNQKDQSGKLFGYIEEGTTLDFQGSIINPDQDNKVFFDVNKPINIISTTHDAYIDLNTTAGSLFGENPGNRFTISYGGSWTNMTGITFHNTQLWLFNTHHVTLDGVNNIIEDQRVGSGVGATSIRANSTWVTVKNGYFYTRNNGGSSSLVMAWADYCTFDNNTVVVEGTVGNMIYLTTYNVDVPDGVLANVYNNITNNRIYGPSKVADIAWGLVVTGANNLIANNYIHTKGVGINQQWGQGDFLNNVYANNIVDGGGAAYFLPTSTVFNNTVTGEMSTGANSVVYKNTVLKSLTVNDGAEVFSNTLGGLTLSGEVADVHDNVIDGTTLISASGVKIHDNTFNGDNLIKFGDEKAKNVIFANNSVFGYIEFANKNAKNNLIVNNTITTSKNYAIDLKTYVNTYNNISDNVLSSKSGFGNNAVNHVEDETLILENYQNLTAEISIEVTDIKVGETAVFVVVSSEASMTGVDVFVNGRKYTLNLVNGEGSVGVDGLLSGSYSVLASSNDKNFGAQSNTTLTVTKNDCPEILIDAPEKLQWVDSMITVTIADATGNVTLSVNGYDMTAGLVDGVASFAVPDLAPGEYDFTVSYSGDYKYLDNATASSLTVSNNMMVKIIASDVVFDRLATVYTVRFTNYIGEAIANAFVTVKIGDEIYPKVTDSNGTVTIDLALTRGLYDVDISFEAIEGRFEAARASALIKVIDATVIDITSITGDFKIAGILKDANGKTIANATISYVIGGVEANTLTDGDGAFSVQAKDNCNVTFIFKGDEISNPSDKSISLSNFEHIKDVVIEIKNANHVAVDTAAGEKGKMFYFTLRDADGNEVANRAVKVSFNGKIYSVTTNAAGKAGIAIAAATAKTYDLDVFFMGDRNYMGATATAKVKVAKKTTSITPKKASYTFKANAKSKIIQATLKTSNKYLKAGKKVTITIKGKTYTAKTGKNGLIKLNINALNKKGTYNAKIKFAGDSTYKASLSKFIKIIVK